MSQEISWNDAAARSSIPVEELIKHERGSVSGNKRRVAEFDWQLPRRASEQNGATGIARTFADYLDINNRAARRYEQLTAATIELSTVRTADACCSNSTKGKQAPEHMPEDDHRAANHALSVSNVIEFLYRVHRAARCTEWSSHLTLPPPVRRRRSKARSCA
jgi:hypothetical protein